MSLDVGLPVGCLAVTQGSSGTAVLAAGLSKFAGRYWTGEIVIASASAGGDELGALGKSSLRAGVAGLAWLPTDVGTGSRFLVSGSDDGRLDLWDFAAAEDAALANLHSIVAHDDIITDVASSPAAAAASVASCSRDCSVRTWACTAADIQCVEALTGHAEAVHCVAWGTEPAVLLSGSRDATARAWDTRTGACSALLDVGCAVHAAAAYPGSACQIAVGAAHGVVYVFDLRRPASALSQQRLHADAVRRLAFSTRTGCALALASASDDGQVLLSSTSQKLGICWEPRATLRPAGGAYVHGLTWSPVTDTDSQPLLFAGGWDGSITCTPVDLAS
ncbi:hypothetical protein WJX81_001883 [Elliptochloris bilobata]|uniref:Uncharacterized protein n=1 Tax=Elliptochloris bilobata TaxID=381761 RepID=A0AAW1RBL1_9CHLO